MSEGEDAGAGGGRKEDALCPKLAGLITHDGINIVLPGHIHRKGRIGVVSRGDRTPRRSQINAMARQSSAVASRRPDHGRHIDV